MHLLMFGVFLFLKYAVNGSFQKELVVRIEGGPLVAELLAIETGHQFKGQAPVFRVATNCTLIPDRSESKYINTFKTADFFTLLESGKTYQVVGFDDTYVLIPVDKVTYLPNEQKRGSLTRSLSEDQRVLWAEEQQWKQRSKRDLVKIIDPSDIPKERVKRIEFNMTQTESNIINVTTVEKSNITQENAENPYIGSVNNKMTNLHEKNRLKRFATSSEANNVDQTFNDELWSQQWYLRDTRTRLDLPKLDLNVLPIYRAGITGKGVRISILDDGIEYTHEDLSPNYDPDISYNCNEENNDPLPRYEVTKSNSHGTRCAGEVAMVANNKKCGVGIAFNAKIGGVKMLDGLVTDRIEGTALGYAQNLVDIYSASWGPNDDGKTVDGPGRLAREAIERGIRKGRNGKGSIYVWASGNGGSRGDNCNCDGYLASPYTISVGSASQKGEFPWYGEACASTLAVTYSSGAYKDQMIATTDLNNQCTIKHTGTSASAPLAAGIIALALEVNPSLTWRDVQHLIVWTSELAPVADNPGWQKNAAGLWFSTKFGFGLMNAFGLVSAAANWTNVSENYECEVRFDTISNSTVSFGNQTQLHAVTTGCQGTNKEVIFLEHVEVRTSINYTIRGALEIHLTSPAGTTVQLLAPRKFDKSTKGFVNWTFMSVMTWGELASGRWTMVVSDNVGPEDNFGTIGETYIILRGTKNPPAHMLQGPRNYNEDYNRIHNRMGEVKISNLLHRIPKRFFDYDYYNDLN